MHVLYGYDHTPLNARGETLAIGNFDGVHRGHQALLARAQSEAKKLHGLAGVMMFEPHPRELFQPERPHFRLTPLTEKLRLLTTFGLDLAVVLDFNRALSSLTRRRLHRARVWSRALACATS